MEKGATFVFLVKLDGESAYIVNFSTGECGSSSYRVSGKLLIWTFELSVEVFPLQVLKFPQVVTALSVRAVWSTAFFCP